MVDRASSGGIAGVVLEVVVLALQWYGGRGGV